MEDEQKQFHRQEFNRGQKAVAKELAEQIFEDETELAKRAGKVACDVIDLADQLAVDGDPHKKQIANILKSSVVKAMESMQRVGDGTLTVEERKAAIEKARPFSEGSSPSTTHSLNGQTQTGSRALPYEPPSDQEKPRRGRPPGSKTRLKGEAEDKS